MRRAAVVIGIDKTGDLPRLKDAARGARLMEAWARSQKMDPVHVFTDEAGPVEAGQIKKAVARLVEAGNLSQLVVYFAGHGVNIQRQEYWLLSDAPEDSQAAVNVATSAALAATCGIPHVVLISDACRTAPEGIRAQSIRGSEIFPNREEDARPVDQFFACQLGKPSHEVRDPAVTSAEFRALYTQALVPALAGRRPTLVEWTQEGGARAGHIHLRPLRDHLSSAMAAELARLNLQTRVIQVPVATISSDPPAWISSVDVLAGGSLGLAPDAALVMPAPRAPGAQVWADRSVTRSPILPADVAPLPATRPTTGAIAHTANTDLTGLLAQPFGPSHHETQCGFAVRGARIVDFACGSIHVGFATGQLAHGEDLRVGGAPRPGANVLLVMDTGAGVVLPAIPDFMCRLTFAEDELIDVAYEPSDNTARWTDFQARAADLRMLRAVAAEAMTRGSFQLDGDEVLDLARRMQLAKGIDPGLGLYAAYAYHDLQRRDLIRQMGAYMRGDLGEALFDVALLAGFLDKQQLAKADLPLGPFPLLSKGWTLMRAFDVRLPEPLRKLEALRLPSLWTLFDAAGVDVLRQCFANGELQ